MNNSRQYSLLISFLFFFGAAAQHTDSLKLALKRATHDTTRCNILSALVEAETDDTVWPEYNMQLLALVESKLKTTSKTAPEYRVYQKQHAAALSNLGYLANFKGDISKAIDYQTKSLKIQEEIGDKKGCALSLNNIGEIYKSQGNILKALEYHERSLLIRKEIKDNEGIASSLNSIGFIYKNQGDIPKALDYYSEGLKIREEIRDKLGIARSLNNIGGVYYKQGDTAKSLEFFERTLKLFEELDDKEGIANSMNNIGGVCHNQGNYKKALEYYNKCLTIQENIGYKKGIASTLTNIATVYRDLGDIQKALEFYGKSLTINEAIQNKTGICTTLYNIGGLYFKQHLYNMALNYTLKSMYVARELGYPEMIRNAAGRLNQIYKITGNYKLGLENYELYIQMRDSINNIETQKASIKQQSKYEYEKQKALEDEKHGAELKIQEEKAMADVKRQNTIIGAVSIVLVLVALFSVLLYNRFKTTQKQKGIIEKKEKETQEQKHIIEEKQKEILDSIAYAKRIQYTLLAHDAFLKENLPQHIVYFNPKDIVSGDFYWATKKDNLFYLAVCDSTGHGVPGAFMSLLNIGFLNEAINEKGIEKPNEVFNYVREKLTNTISKEGQRDGFDGILVCFNQKKKSITYASANNAPVHITNNTIIELSYDRMPVGLGEKKESFTLHTLEARTGDMIYLYTDGYADQFGGPNGKKFKYKQLNDMLVAQHTKPMDQQKHDLTAAFYNWKGDLEQVDDVCVVGIKL